MRMSIPFLGLQRQDSKLDNELIEAIRGVFESGSFILGENVRAFEGELAAYCGVGYAVGLASGTDALVLSLRALGIGPGDEVITSPFTFIATAEAISFMGARPVFVDIDSDSFNMRVDEIAQVLTSRTKAIIPVHLYGHPVEMDSLNQIIGDRDIAVVEDACQAIGAKYYNRMVGSIGNVGCFSFFPSKNLGGCGDGGIIVTNERDLAEKIRILRNHGSSKRYYHDVLGYNSRLDELQAAILRIKLRRLDEWNEARNRVADRYGKLISQADLNDRIRIPFVAQGVSHVFHQYTVLVENRDNIRQYLDQKGISTMVYYPVPLHLQEAYRGLGYKLGDFPIAETCAERVLSLPCFPELTDSEQEKVIDIIVSYYRK